MFTCRDVIEKLGDYHDGLSPRRERAGVFVHLLLCRHCRRYLRSYRRTVTLARECLTQVDVGMPPGLAEETVRRMLAARNLN